MRDQKTVSQEAVIVHCHWGLFCTKQCRRNHWIFLKIQNYTHHVKTWIFSDKFPKMCWMKASESETIWQVHNSNSYVKSKTKKFKGKRKSNIINSLKIRHFHSIQRNLTPWKIISRRSCTLTVIVDQISVDHGLP